jgi:hypothetical protein
MKKQFLPVLLFLSILIFSGCKKIDELTEFDIEYSTELTIPASGLSINQPITINSPEIPTNGVSKFTENNTAKNLIDEIKLSRFNISVVNPTGANLDFMNSLEIYIAAGSISESLFAKKTPIPSGSSSIAMDLEGQNLKDYIFEDKFKMRLRLVPDQALTADVKIKIDQTMHVKGKRLKK